MNRDIKPVANLAEMAHAVDMEKRVSTLEAIIPTLATKTDVEKVRTDFERGQKETRAWMLATVLGMVIVITSVGGFAANFYANRIDRAIELATERSLNAERAADRATERSLSAERAAERTAAAVERIEARLNRSDSSDP